MKTENITEEQLIANDPNVSSLMKLYKVRGYLTYEELNDILPSSEYDSEKISDIMAYFNENDVKIINIEEAESLMIDDEEQSNDDIEDKDDETEIIDEGKGDDPVK